VFVNVFGTAIGLHRPGGALSGRSPRPCKDAAQRRKLKACNLRFNAPTHFCYGGRPVPNSAVLRAVGVNPVNQIEAVSAPTKK
jgi:hypothetical protein